MQDPDKVPTPIGAAPVERVQTQMAGAGPVSLQLDIGFGPDDKVSYVKIIRWLNDNPEASRQVEVFHRPARGGSGWYFLARPGLKAFRQEPQSKVASFLMERYNLDINWDGKLPLGGTQGITVPM